MLVGDLLHIELLMVMAHTLLHLSMIENLKIGE